MTGPNGLISRVGYPHIVLAVALSAAGLLAVILSSSSTAATGVTCDGRAATKFGTQVGDTLQGTRGPDVINGRGGNDTIIGMGGRDRLCGGGGNDEIFGGKKPTGFSPPGSGNDRLFGGSGNDRLHGGDGSDDLFGFNGEDHLFGGDQADLLKGGGENDALFGGDDRDECKQDEGGGTIQDCEADLSISVSGPFNAFEGRIEWFIDIRNSGPSDVYRYEYFLNEDNHHLTCGGPYPWEGVNPKFDLRAGHTDQDFYVTTCTDPGPSAREFVDARLQDNQPHNDPNEGNNHDRLTTAVRALERKH